MNAAAITNSGKAISVLEFISSAIFCAIATRGWSLKPNRTAAQRPNTRKIGIPAQSSPKNISRKSIVHIVSVSLLLDLKRPDAGPRRSVYRWQIGH
ncbi:hypothetical protein ABIF00_008770 [Bradyrhizobium elkanii]